MARGRNDTVILTAASLGAIAGMRSMAAAALLAHELGERGTDIGGGQLERLLGSEATSRLLTLFAGGEMLADKAPFMPDRTSMLPLAGRALIGSLTAGVFAAHQRVPVAVPAAVGAAAAIASTFAAFHLRTFAAERLHIPDRLLGLLEDGLVMLASRSVVAALDDADEL